MYNPHYLILQFCLQGSSVICQLQKKIVTSLPGTTFLKIFSYIYMIVSKVNQMKKIVFLFITSAFLSGCKKDVKVKCNTHTELTGYEHLVDISGLKNNPEIYDTLTKYQLQVRKVVNDNYLFGFKSYVFYKGLMVFNQDYYLYKNKADNNFTIIGKPAPDAINFSLSPTLSSKEAIDIAEKNMDFDKTCISYRLGIYNLNGGISNAMPNHKLVWKIQGDNGWPFVMLDAHTGYIYSKDDGIRI